MTESEFEESLLNHVHRYGPLNITRTKPAVLVINDAISKALHEAYPDFEFLQNGITLWDGFTTTLGRFERAERAGQARIPFKPAYYMVRLMSSPPACSVRTGLVGTKNWNSWDSKEFCDPNFSIEWIIKTVVPTIHSIRKYWDGK